MTDKMTFRLLRADEIECRISRCTEKGVQLLLYKDARCDQNILDETVGPLNWQRHHTRDNKNCIVSIWDDKKQQWIEKEDTGTESNKEAEKGLASDSFKRACFNHGIGRELYTSPFIWFNSTDVNLNGKKCYDTFRVTDIAYDGRTINSVTIIDESTNISKTFGKQKKAASRKSPTKKAASVTEVVPDPEEVPKVSESMISVMRKELERIGRDESLLTNLFKVRSLQDMTVVQFNKAMNKFKISPSKEQKDE